MGSNARLVWLTRIAGGGQRRVSVEQSIKP
jgi:hypothetical protein